jgi:transposase-like protein
MGKTTPPYTPEFRAEAVRLARTSGLRLSEIAADLGCSTESLRHWVQQTKVVGCGVDSAGFTATAAGVRRSLRAASPAGENGWRSPMVRGCQ